MDFQASPRGGAEADFEALMLKLVSASDVGSSKQVRTTCQERRGDLLSKMALAGPGRWGLINTSRNFHMCCLRGEDVSYSGFSLLVARIAICM
jgi:hypothetical protein